LRVSLYKVSIVASESQKSVNFSYVAGSRPFLNLIHLCLVHPHLSLCDLYPKEVEMVLFECALLWV
jgi:hypothetical protein